jgi:hypothetical protein
MDGSKPMAPPVQIATSSTSHRTTNQGQRYYRLPDAKLVLMMLECAGLLKEIIKTSDHSAGTIVVPQAVKGRLSNF